MRGRTRLRLEEGIFADVYGLAAVVKVGKVQREQRWPLGTDRDILRSWRIQKRAELDADRAAQPVIPRGALQKDGEAWILRKEGLPCFAADRSHLRAWYGALGPRLRSSITRDDVERVIAGWRNQEPVLAIRTIRHRCRVLRELYQGLDGKKARTPVDDVRLQRPPAPEPIAVPTAVLKRVAKNLKANPDPRVRKHYARFLVRVITGQRPSQIMRATRDDIDLRRKLWFVKAGKGGRQIPLPLTPEMIKAWKVFIAADAWGPFDTAVAADVLRRHGWPADIRPYAARSTLAIDMLLGGADLGDVQAVLGHSQIQTTRSHYAPILTARLASVLNRRKLTLG